MIYTIASCIPGGFGAIIAWPLAKKLGLVPYSYVTASLFSSALDNVEYRTGMRLDGMLGVAVVGLIQGLIYSPFAGLYETILLSKGFDAALAVQNAPVQAAIANGEEWIDPEELARREQEEIAREHEENRIADLRARCAKKGLDFDTENQRYLKKKALKDAKMEK